MSSGRGSPSFSTTSTPLSSSSSSAPRRRWAEAGATSHEHSNAATVTIAPRRRPGLSLAMPIGAYQLPALAFWYCSITVSKARSIGTCTVPAVRSIQPYSLRRARVWARSVS